MKDPYDGREVFYSKEELIPPYININSEYANVVNNEIKEMYIDDYNKFANIGNAGEYFVAGELERRGFTVGVPMSNVKDYDILCINKNGKQFALQVKTTSYGSNKWILSNKNEKITSYSYADGEIHTQTTKNKVELTIVSGGLLINTHFFEKIKN